MQSHQRVHRRKANLPIPCEPPDSEACELWQRNALESPILRLPPEIRNHIFALVLAVGHIHIRYQPWRHRKGMRQGAMAFPEGTESNQDRGSSSFYGLVFDAEQDPWSRWVLQRFTMGAGGTPPAALGDALTPLSAVCRQLYRETAVLPFSLNSWSFQDARVMERYLMRERRLTRLQRRGIAVLVVSDDLPSRAMEAFLGGLQVVIWKDGNTFRRWDMRSATELRRLLLESTAASQKGVWSSASGFWHLYE